MARLVYISIVALLALVLSALYANSLLCEPIKLPESGYYNISKGSSLNSVANNLSQSGVVTVPGFVVKAYALVTQSDGTIKAGEYKLYKTDNVKSILSRFRLGKVAQRAITFPEGWRLTDWLVHLASNPYLSHDLSNLSEPEMIKMLAAKPEGGLEGQFFPDTYLFTRGESESAILRRAEFKMQQVLSREWATRSSNTPLKSVQELLVLASIVEKETGYEPDRGYVASVFVNRLQKKMKLQSDPTVIYGVKNFNGNLTRRHLKTKTVYNTYVNRGLPPLPICNPGLASIRASLHPEVSGFYYFVARGDGRSEFSATLQEHNRAVSRFQKTARVDNYKSTPK